jgi:hypothetical protein
MIRKLAWALVALVVLATGGLFLYYGVILPRDIPVPDLTLATSAEQIERGRYLANHVAVCMDCHSRRDWSYFSGPLMPGTLGQGGERFDAATGLPGVVISKNITPAGIGEWSDGELHRAITGGLRRDGAALFPLMPYDAYRFMPEEDVLAIMAYVRSIPPIANEVPEHDLDFPLSLLVNAIPKPAEPRSVNRLDPVEYGGYLATVGGCIWCHTPVNERGQTVREAALAGGHEFPMGGFLARSANITPDPETGIGTWTREDFLARFRRYQGKAGLIPTRNGDFNSPMPWTRYAEMTEPDLSAIYAYLMQSRPIASRVEIYQRQPRLEARAPD